MSCDLIDDNIMEDIRMIRFGVECLGADFVDTDTLLYDYWCEFSEEQFYAMFFVVSSWSVKLFKDWLYDRGIL